MYLVLYIFVLCPKVLHFAIGEIRTKELVQLSLMYWRRQKLGKGGQYFATF